MPGDGVKIMGISCYSDNIVGKFPGKKYVTPETDSVHPSKSSPPTGLPIYCGHCLSCPSTVEFAPSAIQ